MSGYIKGSQAWYDHTRKRVVELSMKLRSPELSQEEKDKIYYGEYGKLICELADFESEDVVNNPI